MAVWGVVSACTALVQNFNGLVVARFFLGFMEAYVVGFKYCERSLTNPGLTFLEPSFYCQVGILARSWPPGLLCCTLEVCFPVGLVASLVRVLSMDFTGSVGWSLGGELYSTDTETKTNDIGGYLSLKGL